MEKKTFEIPVYQTKSVQTGTKSKEVFISLDKKEFDNEQDCINHEVLLKEKEEARKLFIPLNLESGQDSALLNLCFNESSAICISFVQYTMVKGQNDKLYNYLSKLGFNGYHSSELFRYAAGDKIIIACWSERDYYNDREQEYMASISVEEIKETVDKFNDKIKNL